MAKSNWLQHSLLLAKADRWRSLHYGIAAAEAARSNKCWPPLITPLATF